MRKQRGGTGPKVPDAARKSKARGVRIVTIAAKRTLIGLGTGSGLLLIFLLLPVPSRRVAAQQKAGQLRLNVDLVQLNVAVIDKKGNYVSGLRPEDFKVTEDNIAEKLASFEEGSQLVNEVASSDSVPARQNHAYPGDI